VGILAATLTVAAGDDNSCSRSTRTAPDDSDAHYSTFIHNDGVRDYFDPRVRSTGGPICQCDPVYIILTSRSW